MKVSLVIFSILIIQTGSVMAADKTEKQPYRVVREEKGFEIRYYPSAILATVHSSAQSYRELAYPGFRKLAGYIFGGNQSGEKIAMTSPVHMDINDSLSSMSFVMPSAYDMEKLPAPENSEVELKRTEDEYVAALRFKGYASDRRIRSYSGKLKKLLDEHSIDHKGPFRFLGYDPPYKPFGRRNEIIVSVEWTE